VLFSNMNFVEMQRIEVSTYLARMWLINAHVDDLRSSGDFNFENAIWDQSE